MVKVKKGTAFSLLELTILVYLVVSGAVWLREHCPWSNSLAVEHEKNGESTTRRGVGDLDYM
jgi:hypothetical protein